MIARIALGPEGPRTRGGPGSPKPARGGRVLVILDDALSAPADPVAWPRPVPEASVIRSRVGGTTLTANGSLLDLARINAPNGRAWLVPRAALQTIRGWSHRGQARGRWSPTLPRNARRGIALARARFRRVDRGRSTRPMIAATVLMLAAAVWFGLSIAAWHDADVAPGDTPAGQTQSTGVTALPGRSEAPGGDSGSRPTGSAAADDLWIPPVEFLLAATTTSDAVQGLRTMRVRGPVVEIETDGDGDGIAAALSTIPRVGDTRRTIVTRNGGTRSTLTVRAGAP